MNEYQIIDVSQWEEDKTIAKGTKEKKLFVHPDTRRLVMFKFPAEGSGDIWAEKITTEVGKCIKYNVHEVDIGIYKGIYGSLIYWFLEGGEDLIEGADLIKNEGHEFDEWTRNGYNIQLIEKVINKYDPNFIRDFIEIIVLDILIGNTDRHSQNWGIIVSKEGKRRITPAYDNSSSLGRELNSNPELMLQKLRQKDLFKKYCHSKKGSILIGFDNDYKIPHLVYIRLILNTYPEVTRLHLQKLRLLETDLIHEIVNKVPVTIMNNSCKAFAIELLEYRKNYLLNILEEVN